MLLLPAIIVLAVLEIFSVAHALLPHSVSQNGLHCSKLEMIPSPYSYNGTDLKNVAISCILHDNRDWTIDVFELISTHTSVNISTDIYTYVDIYLNCSTANYNMHFKVSEKKNMNIITTLRLKDCLPSYDELSRLGETLYLIHVAFNYIQSSPFILSKEQLMTNYPGLINMIQFSIAINYQRRNIIDIEKILPVLPSIGDLSLICVNELFDPEGCKTVEQIKMSKVRLKWLKTYYPQLQTLLLSAINVICAPGEKFDFPWTNQTRYLPLNLSRSSFQQHQYTNGIKTLTDDNVFRRVFHIGYNPNITLDVVCPFAGPVDKFVFANQNAAYIPNDCFCGTLNLTAFDISNGLLDQRSINNLTFQGLSKLKSLNMRHNNLDVLETGMFDDLTGLKTLNLDYNNIQKLSSGVFKNLLSLEVLYIHQNYIETVEPGTLPIYSMSLQFVDFRWNSLKALVSDCLKLPNLAVCDMDNNFIDLSNLKELVGEHFDPVRLYMVEPLAYNGQPLGHYDEGVPHETDQSRISLRNNTIIHAPVNLSAWTEFEMQQMAAMISVFQINLSDNKLRCDCPMYDMKLLVTDPAYSQVEPDRPLYLAKYRETLLYSQNNFKSWKCSVHHLLGENRTSFTLMWDQYYLCNVTGIEPNCPDKCECFRSPKSLRFGPPQIVVDCAYRYLKTLPKRMPLPDNREHEMRISLHENDIERLPECVNYRCVGDYEWLHHVTVLDLEHNIIQPEGGIEDRSNNLEGFLYTLSKVKQLKLAYNNIFKLPETIRFKNFTNLTISGNKIDCDCNNIWLRDWLRDKNQSIHLSLILTCRNGPRPIVELTNEEFEAHCPGVGKIYYLFILLVIPLIMGLISLFVYRRELNLIIFEKLGVKFMDRLNGDHSLSYDAVLVYADDDAHWAQNTLLKNLEYTYRYKIADYVRDTELGRTISAEDCKLLANAQRAIILMSNSFIADERCMKVFDQARNYSKNKRFLLLIQMEGLRLDVSNHAHQDIANFLKTNFFVDIRNANRSLARLCYWMPQTKKPPPMTENLPPRYLRCNSTDLTDFEEDNGDLRLINYPI